LAMLRFNILEDCLQRFEIAVNITDDGRAHREQLLVRTFGGRGKSGL
jgi:hypothetical protein